MNRKVRKKSPGSCRFLKLPLVLRELIYRMLLTTPYCMQFTQSDGPFWKFRLHTAILLANKQISAKAKIILYEGNDFIILKTTGITLCFHLIPKFRHLSENMVTSPLLRIKVSGTRFQEDDPQTLITTVEGLQAIISVIWAPEPHLDLPLSENINHGDMSVTLNFTPKAQVQYDILSDLVLKPWGDVYGLKRLVLSRQIKGPIREHLEKCNLEGPFTYEVSARIVEYHSIAEIAFEKQDYNTARWWWILLSGYWQHINDLVPYRMGGFRMSRSGTEIWEVLRNSLTMYSEGRLMLVKASLHLSDYAAAESYASHALSSVEDWAEDFGYTEHPPVMRKKFEKTLLLERAVLSGGTWLDVETAKKYITGPE